MRDQIIACIIGVVMMLMLLHIMGEHNHRITKLECRLVRLEAR